MTIERINETGGVEAGDGNTDELGTTILLVEQNAEKGLSIADRGYVLASGEIRHTGSGAELLDDEEVGRLYLDARSAF